MAFVLGDSSESEVPGRFFLPPNQCIVYKIEDMVQFTHYLLPTL